MAGPEADTNPDPDLKPDANPGPAPDAVADAASSEPERGTSAPGPEGDTSPPEPEGPRPLPRPRRAPTPIPPPTRWPTAPCPPPARRTRAGSPPRPHSPSSPPPRRHGRGRSAPPRPRPAGGGAGGRQPAAAALGRTARAGAGRARTAGGARPVVRAGRPAPRRPAPQGRERLAGGGSAEEALWDLWDGTPWPTRLERSARRGGAAGRNADRDLDAVCALFATAARAEERTGGRGALNFLEEIDAEDIAADTLTRRAVRPDAVRLMTAHRAKGLEWRLVVVAASRRGCGRTCAAGAPCWRPTASAATDSPNRSRPAHCSPRNAACSTSPPRARVNGSS